MTIERLDIVTGCKCNNNCIFCVRSDEQKQLKNRAMQEMAEDMKRYARYCKNLTLTGGETTTRKDIFELIKIAKKLGFKEIHLQTNARMLYYEEFCKRLVKEGVTSFTVSFHSQDNRLGDFLSRTNGSYSQTIKGMQNIKKYGARLITNTVICKQNYKSLFEITKKAIALGSDQVQMVFIRPQGQVLKDFSGMVPKMKDTIPYVRESIDYCRAKNKTALIEGIPFCLMRSYEKNIAEKYMPVTKIMVDKRFYSITKKGKTKIKHKKCKTCKLYKECTGVWTEYARKIGFGEFTPIN